jgi:uncharacterized OsmC-like protein
MNPDRLRELQTPLKAKYRADPASAQMTLRATGVLNPNRASCTLQTYSGPVEAGLHPATGGDGTLACSGDMLLEALVACAGVTLAAVATAMGIVLRSGTVTAEGDLDFRGTLGVSKDVDVGFNEIRLQFSLDTDASQEQIQSLLKLTERYCVIYQTLRKPPTLTHSFAVKAKTAAS